MVSLPFVKYTSCGNNFLILDETREPLLSESEKAYCATRATNGYFGIGADGFILLQPHTADQLAEINRQFRYWPTTPAGMNAQFIFRLFEPNGKESFSCGNGLLCAAHHLQRRYGIRRAAILTELPTTAPKPVSIGVDNGAAWVLMGPHRSVPPEIAAPEVRNPLAPEVDRIESVEISLRSEEWGRFAGRPDSLSLSGWLTFTGEPHLVVFPTTDFAPTVMAETLFIPAGENSEEKVSFGAWLVHRIGKWLNRELRLLFPDGINVDFVRVVDAAAGTLEYRCFERGIERETLACGTGAVAAAAVAREVGFIRRDRATLWPYRCRWHQPDAHMRVRKGPAGWTLFGDPLYICRGRFFFDKTYMINTAGSAYMDTEGARPAKFSMRSAFEVVKNRFPAVKKAMRENGDTPLSEYLRPFTAPDEPCQPRDDLLAVFGRHIEELLGKTVSDRAVAHLSTHPVVLTAAHHGVDYFFSSVHSSLAYALGGFNDASTRATVPVFAFGNVPLNNATYPRGMLIYRVMPETLGHMPLKLPIFPSRSNRCMVSRTPAFDAESVSTALARVHRMVIDQQIPPVMGEAVHQILTEEYLESAVLDQPTYARQAVLLNHRIGRRLWERSDEAPDMTWMEQETLTSALLYRDLKNTESLAHRVFFTSGIRQRVLGRLEGIRGCWQRRSEQNDRPSGTVFFWGVDSHGRRAPLHLEGESGVRPILIGEDDRRAPWRVPLTPEAIMEGLAAGELLPSLFTCFLVVALARGMACVGGYYQCEYLPAMRDAVTTALEAEGAAEMARRVAATPADLYLGHSLGIMSAVGDRYLAPAGPLEIMASGGLTSKEVAAVGRVTVRQAHLAALFEGVQDALSAKSLPPNWTVALARDCHVLLRRKVVIK